MSDARYSTALHPCPCNHKTNQTPDTVQPYTLVPVTTKPTRRLIQYSPTPLSLSQCHQLVFDLSFSLARFVLFSAHSAGSWDGAVPIVI
jgi:hypothetical protein